MALIRFSSKAAGELFMFEEHARRIFALIGKEPSARGIVTPEQIPGALAALSAAIAAEEQAIAEARAKRQREHDEEAPTADNPQFVRLAQRAFPLIDMLERAQRKGVDVLWGV